MASSILEKRSVTAVVCLIFGLIFEVSNGAVYKVGDSAGWTTIGNVDYKQWAASKSFQLGDIIVFEYNPQFHNVMQVIHSEYQACNVSSPISTHTTGNDSITINNHGHHFFVCGVPGHCQAGQKVDINVLRSPSDAPTQSGIPSSGPAATLVPAPSPSAASRPALIDSPFLKLGWLLLLLQLSLMLLLNSYSDISSLCYKC